MKSLLLVATVLACAWAQSEAGLDDSVLRHDRKFMDGYCPAFRAIWKAYPGYDSWPSEQLLAKLGKGKLSWITNTCAVRTTIALNGVGQDPGKAANAKWTDGVQTYIIRVKTMDRYMRAVYGPPSVTTTSGYKMANGKWIENKAIHGKVGIIKYSDCNWGDASGHFDVWEGYFTKGHGYGERCGKVELWNVCNPRSNPDWTDLQAFAKRTNAARSSTSGVKSRGWFARRGSRTVGHDFWAASNLGIAGIDNHAAWQEATSALSETCPKEPFWEQGWCKHTVQERIGAVQRAAKDACCECPQKHEKKETTEGKEVCVAKEGVLGEKVVVGPRCCGLPPNEVPCKKTCTTNRADFIRAQRKLGVVADGVFGRKSMAALKAYQREQNQEVTECLTHCALAAL